MIKKSFLLLLLIGASLSAAVLVNQSPTQENNTGPVIPENMQLVTVNNTKDVNYVLIWFSNEFKVNDDGNIAKKSSTWISTFIPANSTKQVLMYKAANNRSLDAVLVGDSVQYWDGSNPWVINE